MKVNLFKVEGYEAAIMALRMSKGKHYSHKRAMDIRELVHLVTDEKGAVCDKWEYEEKHRYVNVMGGNEKITGDYLTDVTEFKRLLGLTMDNAMGKHKHHTLMKYIDVTFITEGLHRGAQDDLDAHAIAFNNRITRFSTRLAEIDEVNLSEWYQDKVIPFDVLLTIPGTNAPDAIMNKGKRYVMTPFGYVLEKYAQVPAKNGLAKDVQRGLMPLGMESNAIWKIDLASLRYVYHMRSKLTKANPELKDMMEELANQIEFYVPVFGERFREVYTDSGTWEHTNKVKTVSSEEYQEFKRWKKQQGPIMEV